MAKFLEGIITEQRVEFAQLDYVHLLAIELIRPQLPKNPSTLKTADYKKIITKYAEIRGKLADAHVKSRITEQVFSTLRLIPQGMKCD